MKRRLIVLLLILGSFRLVLMALPPIPPMKASRLATELPETFNDWIGKPRQVGQKEREILAADTEFERMSYSSLDRKMPPIEASIVFSGQNPTQSIHRPHICLQAQGWKFFDRPHINFEDVLNGGESLPMRENICYRPRLKEQDGEIVPVLTESGEPVIEWQASYYTFFGYEQIVSGHYERTLIDIKDRLFKGHSQRWAYATFTVPITGKYAEQGLALGGLKELDEAGTREHIRKFLKELLPQLVAGPKQGQDPSLPSN